MAEPHAAHSDDAAYTRGEMQIVEHKATYKAFDVLLRYGSLAIAVLVLFLTLMFCTGVGFIGAAAPAVILLAIGLVVLRKAPPSTETL